MTVGWEDALHVIDLIPASINFLSELAQNAGPFFGYRFRPSPSKVNHHPTVSLVLLPLPAAGERCERLIITRR